MAEAYAGDLNFVPFVCEAPDPHGSGAGGCDFRHPPAADEIARSADDSEGTSEFTRPRPPRRVVPGAVTT